MPGIDWAYLGALGGEALEDFAATCLCQRYSDARQTRPASGDGGIDVVRETPEGLVVWQVKRFTTRLTTGQRSQILSSWKRFWETHVLQGTKVLEYHLATPWTPTEPSYEWFRNTVTIGAEFPVRWDGAAFFNALASDFPATADRFFKGPNMLETFVNAKAMLAASPVESGDQIDMLRALSARQDALREIRDLVSDHYYIDTATRTATAALDDPPIDSDSPAVMHRYLYLGENRWSIESIVPKTAQAAEQDPITLQVKFLVEPGSDDEDKLTQWRLWGVPFRDLPAKSRQSGGPFGEEEMTEGRFSFLPVAVKAQVPGLTMTAQDSNGTELAGLSFTVRELTRGTEGGGTRVVARSTSGVLELEARLGSTEADASIELRIIGSAGQRPATVAKDLSRMSRLEEGQVVTVAVTDGPALFAVSSLGAPPVADFVREISEVLVSLAPHTDELLEMPDFREVTNAQLEHAQRLADLYSGNAREGTWDRIVLTVGNPDTFRTNDALLHGESFLVQTETPKFHMGTSEYLITRELATTYCSPTLADPKALESLQAGGELELRAGTDNRVVVAAVVE